MNSANPTKVCMVEISVKLDTFLLINYMACCRPPSIINQQRFQQTNLRNLLCQWRGHF